MKQILRTYLLSFLFIFIPFIFISLILSFLSYFIQLNGFLFNVILEFFAYLILIIVALYFTSQIEKNKLLHGLFFSLIYLLISLLLQLGDINIYHLIAKSSLFTIIGLLKTRKKD